MNKYERRIYHSLSELWADFRAILSQRKQIRSLMRGEGIAPSLRERLMLVVTAVNRCRYCSYAHAREALSTGIAQAEIDALASGMFDDSPPEEVPALLYAQHWAEMDGEPEAPVREQVILHSGEQIVKTMELALRMIRAGNLSGNTFDHLLHRVSSRRFGVSRQSGPE